MLVIHGTALILGSLISALILVALGFVLRGAELSELAAALVILTLIAALLQVVGGRPMQSRWQVPEHWRRGLDMDILAAAYGLLLGFGFFTAVVVSGFWLFASLSLVLEPVTVLLGWTAYAVTRGVAFAFGVSTLKDRERFLVPRELRMLATMVGVVGVFAVTLNLAP